MAQGSVYNIIRVIFAPWVILDGYIPADFIALFIKRLKILHHSCCTSLLNQVSGNIVIVPANGRVIGNPYFNPPGPARHMVVIRGYDPVTKEFITNDPGTERGENYRYPEAVLYNGIRDYPTGYHKPIVEDKKVMIVVGK